MVTLHVTCANKAMRPIQATASLLWAHEDTLPAGRASLGVMQSLTHGSGWLGESGIFSKPCSGFVKALPCCLPVWSMEKMESLIECWLLSLLQNVNMKGFTWVHVPCLTHDGSWKKCSKNLPFACHALGCVREAQRRSQWFCLFILQFLACGQSFHLNELHHAAVIVLTHFLPAMPNLLRKKFHSVFLELLSRKQGK